MEGYILITDILEFSKIIKNLSDQNLSEKIKIWPNLIKTLISRHQEFKYSLLSDTLFVTAPSTPEGLHTLIEFAKKLLEEALNKSFPLRGAISHGSYEWASDMIYGKAVLKAHELEKNQQWIGITLDEGIIPSTHRNGDITTHTQHQN